METNKHMHLLQNHHERENNPIVVRISLVFSILKTEIIVSLAYNVKTFWDLTSNVKAFTTYKELSYYKKT